jgi:hypothetical protein
MTKRFAELSSEDLNNILTNKYSKNTKINDDYAYKLFKTFCESKTFEYSGNKSEMANVLMQFFPSVRRKDGDSFRVGGLMTIYHAITRVLKCKYDLDIKEDPTFKCVREMLQCIKNEMKKCGKGFIKHTDVISKFDLEKIGNMPIDTPKRLQLKAWFTIQLHFAKRAMENTHDMVKNDLVMHTDAQGRKCVTLMDNITKNHRGSSNQESYGGIITSSTDINCPVKLVELYVSHLCKSNKYLWQRPKLAFADSSESYCDMKVGINKMSGFMKEICNQMDLSKCYTNHSVRATSITILGEQFEDTDVATVSGHKSLTNLSIYKRTSDDMKQKMSSALHDALTGQSTSSQQPKNFISTATSKQHHNECCISYGINDSTTQNLNQAPEINEKTLEKNVTLDHDLPLPAYQQLMNESETKNIKNSLLKISDKAFVVNGSGCTITFNVNVNK